MGALHRQPDTDDTEQVGWILMLILIHIENTGEILILILIFIEINISWTCIQEVNVAHFNVHELYDDRTLENDICVVLLAAPLRSNQN